MNGLRLFAAVLAIAASVPLAYGGPADSGQRQARAADDVRDARPFYVLMAYAGTSLGGAEGVDRAYRDVESPAVRIGVTVPVLYMRTTHGRERDWVFDPRFDVAKQCDGRRMADDALDTIIAHSVAKRLPTMFVLNGGVWADASCDSPQWDLNDHLEQDPANCQWSQSDQVFADDYLRGLTGSIDSPQLARSLTYNVYASEVRRYKRRNLQAAATRIARFARSHPELFVGVTLDADTYMNPFFNGEQWFDYNPGTIRQFREWLRGAGPYAGAGGRGVPDLSAYRRRSPLTLADVNRLAGRRWTSWNEVDPPRRFPGSPRDALGPRDRAYWDDPWYNEWDVFRKHVIDLHYDELSAWTHAAGIPVDRIFSAQGFAAPYGRNRPFALRVTSIGQNYDSAGMSLEGAKPGHGHLGAILYGRAAENAIPTENGRSLFFDFATIDEGWGVVEFSVAELNRPDDVAGYPRAYRALRDIFNFDGRFVTPMAWNGSRASDAGKPGYRPHTAWRQTVAEEAMRDFARSHRGVAAGSRLWTFGSPRFASDDGWSAENATLRAETGRIVVEPRERRVVLASPPDQVIRPSRHGRLRIASPDAASVRGVFVHARIEPGGAWIPVSRHAWRHDASGGAIDARLAWPQARLPAKAIATALRIEIELADAARPLVIERVVVSR